MAATQIDKDKAAKARAGTKAKASLISRKRELMFPPLRHNQHTANTRLATTAAISHRNLCCDKIQCSIKQTMTHRVGSGRPEKYFGSENSRGERARKTYQSDCLDEMQLSGLSQHEKFDPREVSLAHLARLCRISTTLPFFLVVRRVACRYRCDFFLKTIQ